MKMLKKLALVSAVSMISAGAFAMEAMDDESMSTATGQSGITIDIAPGAMKLGATAGTFTGLTDVGVSLATQSAIDTAGTAGIVHGLTINQVVIHDDDGFTGSTTLGALVIGNGTAADSTVLFADDLDPIKVDIDSGTVVAAGGAILNVKITTPKLAIKTGSIYVATDSTGHTGGVISGAVKVMNGMEIILGATSINVQLGHEAQSITVHGSALPSMIVVNATLAGGLTINNTKIDDAGAGITGGSMYVGSMSVKDNGGANLTANVGINIASDLHTIPGSSAAAFSNDADASTGGMVITLAQLGSAANGIDVAMTDVRLGLVDPTSAATLLTSAKSLGDIEILGLNLNGSSLIIHGH